MFRCFKVLFFSIFLVFVLPLSCVYASSASPVVAPFWISDYNFGGSSSSSYLGYTSSSNYFSSSPRLYAVSLSQSFDPSASGFYTDLFPLTVYQGGSPTYNSFSYYPDSNTGYCTYSLSSQDYYSFSEEPSYAFVPSVFDKGVPVYRPGIDKTYLIYQGVKEDKTNSQILVTESMPFIYYGNPVDERFINIGYYSYYYVLDAQHQQDYDVRYTSSLPLTLSFKLNNMNNSSLPSDGFFAATIRFKGSYGGFEIHKNYSLDNVHIYRTGYSNDPIPSFSDCSASIEFGDRSEYIAVRLTGSYHATSGTPDGSVYCTFDLPVPFDSSKKYFINSFSGSYTLNERVYLWTSASSDAVISQSLVSAGGSNSSLNNSGSSLKVEMDKFDGLINMDSEFSDLTNSEFLFPSIGIFESLATTSMLFSSSISQLLVSLGDFAIPLNLILVFSVLGCIIGVTKRHFSASAPPDTRASVPGSEIHHGSSSVPYAGSSRPSDSEGHHNIPGR